MIAKKEIKLCQTQCRDKDKPMKCVLSSVVTQSRMIVTHGGKHNWMKTFSYLNGLLWRDLVPSFAN